ncbi:MAG: ATP-binding cassette domain-containing protein [Kiritimatiellaeota bacterium]|nr:ATP-binding cassette domain-containing protein [Kiritimatiellota bacterium]
MRATSAADIAIEVSGLTASYGHKVVLTNVSFSVKRGEVFAILGGSGSGKTTILRHLIGQARPAAGAVKVLDTDVAAAPEDQLRRLRSRFGVLYQTGALFGGMTVGENVGLPLRELTNLPDAAVDVLVRLKLRLVGLEGAENLYPAELSGGMRKRAGLARAMALDPDLLFFDEPSSGLDPVLAAGLDRLIVKLRDAFGTTMVLVTHDLDSVMAVADRVILLSGQARGVVAEGDPRQIEKSAARAEVRDFFSRCGLRHASAGIDSTVTNRIPENGQ